MKPTYKRMHHQGYYALLEFAGDLCPISTRWFISFTWEGDAVISEYVDVHDRQRMVTEFP